MGKPAWGGSFGGCTPSPGEGAPPKPTVTSKAMGGGGSGVNMVPGPQYHNPDPLVRLIGTPNESQVEVESGPHHSFNRFRGKFVSNHQIFC